MRAVMISIKGEWLEKIIKGEKVYEIRKTSPAIYEPYKVYVYCSKTGSDLYIDYLMNGTVCAEFVCDKTFRIAPDGTYTDARLADYLDDKPIKRMKLEGTGMTAVQLKMYLGKKFGNAMHISNLKVYEKPLKVRDFQLEYSIDPVQVPPQNLVYVNEIGD